MLHNLCYCHGKSSNIPYTDYANDSLPPASFSPVLSSPLLPFHPSRAPLGIEADYMSIIESL